MILFVKEIVFLHTDHLMRSRGERAKDGGFFGKDGLYSVQWIVKCRHIQQGWWKSD